VNTWNVYRRGRLINVVFFSPPCDADEARRSLIDHDGSHPARQRPPKTKDWGRQMNGRTGPE
jgi:hypothetical protein